MRLVRIVATLVVVAGSTLAAATPAQAGGWATTLLDPLPHQLEVGTGYTVGYWVLQHGSHPYDGDLGKTGLRLVDQAGKATEYPGVPLPEAAHYATAVVFGHTGTWRLYGIQGIFADYEIGKVTIPGKVDPRPTPPPMTMTDGDSADHWGAIHPPGSEQAGHSGSMGAQTPRAGQTKTFQPAAAQSGISSRLLPVTAIAVVIAAALAVLGRRRWRTRDRGSD